MLIWMRNSAFAGIFKYLLLGLLLSAVLGLVLLDIGGFFTGNVSSNIVAKGGGVSISSSEFDRTLRRVLASQQIPAADAYRLGVVDGVLQSEVQNRLFTQEAQNLGLIVDDDSVKQQIAKLADSIAVEGRSRKEALQQILRSQGISEPEFINSLRSEMANGLLRVALSPPASLASPMMAATLYRYDNETRSADVIVLKNADVKNASPATDEQLKKYYEANKVSYLVPETRTITMATLMPAMMKKNLKIDEAQIRAEYDKNIAAFTKPERRVIARMVLSTEEEAKKTTDEMRAGKTPESAITQDYDEKSLSPELSGPVFAAQKDDVVGPIKDDLGWHVIKVADIMPPVVSPYESVKGQITGELESAALTDQMYQAGATIEDRVAGGDKLEDLVTEYGMTTEIIGPFRSNGYGTDAKDLFKPYGTDRDALIQSAYDTDAGELAPVVETADGQFHLIRVDQVTPDSYKDFAAVKDELAKRWTAEQQKLGNKARAEEALAALNAGKPLADLAKADGVSVQSLSAIKRNAAPPAPLTPASNARLFTTDKGKGFSAETDTGYIVGTVTSISLPSAPEGANKDLEALRDLTGRSLGQDTLGLFVNSLSKGRDIKINKPVLDRTYGAAAQTGQQ